MNHPLFGLLLAATVSLAPVLARGQTGGTATLAIQTDQPGVRISSNLFGIFFEEINNGGDGGLYAELVRNRSFEDSTPTNYWTLALTGSGAGSMSADSSLPLNGSNLWSLQLVQTSGSGTVGAANGGFWGMNLQAGQIYDLTLFARCASGFAGNLMARLENSSSGQVLAQASLGGLTTAWGKRSASLVPSASTANGRLVIALSQPGTVWLDVVSLFPRATFRYRTNGLRPDLANLLSDLKPAFMRFPGGCWVEGAWMAEAYRWKQTIGPLENRATKWDLWGYFSENGLGYHEYLQFCEDLHMEPLFVINCGMAHNDVVPLANMGEYVQDAVDAIDYANGPTNTPWGALRAANGHPAPFNLKYMEIGNEDGGANYNDRYALFYDAIKAVHPEVQLVACVWGGTPTSRPLEIIDEHYYNNAGFFAANAAKYDGYSRSGPKIYVGEYAVTSGGGQGNLTGALGEAAFMTGLERNADIVAMGSYAPLFGNVNQMAWTPDLIYFDSSRVAPTPSYYVQQLFARNRGDVVLPVSVAASLPWQTNAPRRGAIGLGSWNTSVQYTNIVVASNGVTLYQSDFNSGAAEWKVFRGTWSTTGGLYQQTQITTDCRSTTGDTNWANYTITLKARKVSGSEGFLVLFNWLDDSNWTWWNIGGWNNTQHALEFNQAGTKSILGAQVSGSVESNRWYDLRIELSGPRVRCYLDGLLVHDTTYPVSRMGAVGLGTWNTAASYTNVVVAKDGATLYQSDFAGSGAAGWQVYNGAWTTNAGLYQQTSANTVDCRSTTGSTNWSDYTLSLRARKDSGSEGFLIIFNWRDANNFTWWNIGGWSNTKHAIEVSENGVRTTLTEVNGSVTNGGWYDVRVEVSGARLRCYLNNTLVHNVTYSSAPPLFASASYHEASGQIVLKAVNLAGAPLATALTVGGLPAISAQATLVRLSSTNATAANSVNTPTNVVPATSMIANAGTNFSLVLPPNSLSVLRLQTPPSPNIQAGFNVATTNLNDTAAYPDGIPVAVSSFITNTVSVTYTLEAGDGTLITNGIVQIIPGSLSANIPLPAALRQPGAFFRATLVSAVNGQVGGVTRAYFAQSASAGDLFRIGLARFADENLVYWTFANVAVERTTTLPGVWATLTNAACPIRIPGAGNAQFYRLRR